MDTDEVETHEPMTDTDSQDEVQDSLDTANVEEGQNDEIASYEDEVAKLLRGEEPEEEEAEVIEESEGVNGEETESEAQEDSEDSEPENEEVTSEANETDDLPSRFRVRTDDPVEKFAMDLRKRNPDMSLKECLERADEHFNPKSSEDGEGESPTSRAEQIEAEIDELQEQHYKHEKDYNVEEAAEISRKIVELTKELRRIDREEITNMLTNTISEKQAEQKHADLIDSYADQAVQIYPELNDVNSNMHKVALMYDNDQAAKDPEYANSPDRPLIAAKAAAKLLGVASSDQQQQTTTKSQRPVIPAARGNAKTQRPAQATNRIDEALDNISTTDEYEALIEKLNT